MVNAPQRGTIYEVNFNPARGSEQAGIGPALIIQNDAGNSSSSTTIVAAITSSIHGRIYPFEVLLGKGELPKRSMVKCDQIMTVSKERLGKLMGVVPDDVMDEVDEALKHSLGLRRLSVLPPAD